jgi:60 kDa SS-A/Ro ribonucleoprotein
MRLNVKQYTETHEGGKAPILNAEQTLRRSVMSCFLWENEFYEDGESIADRIADAARSVPPSILSSVAIQARKDGMRHVPLLLTSILCQTGKGTSLVSDTLYNTIQRADELAEFVAVYAKLNGVPPTAVKKKLSAQAKKGLAKAFGKFTPYQLAKYNRDGAVKLRDVLFLCHAKPSEEQVTVWKSLAEGTLESPDTWEVALSSGADKKETFTRLLQEGNLGYFALLRNLRNMIESGVADDLMNSAIVARKGADMILPFRYVAAARHAVKLEPAIDQALQAAITELPKLSGKTIVLVDVSGSMDDKLSGKSDMTRMDAAAALASIVSSDSLRVFTFSENLVEVPPRRGMAGIDAVIKSQGHGGTYLAKAITAINAMGTYDRLIVITDEQSHDGSTDPRQEAKGYMINVASNQNGVGYGRWVHIDGFSENVIKYIYASELS